MTRVTLDQLNTTKFLMKNKENCCKKKSNNHLLRRLKSQQNRLNYLTDVSRQKAAAVSKY